MPTTPAKLSGDNSNSSKRLTTTSSWPSAIVGDRAYFAGTGGDELQQQVRAMGHTLMFDYRSTQLGSMEEYMGAIQVEGSWYLPLNA